MAKWMWMVLQLMGGLFLLSLGQQAETSELADELLELDLEVLLGTRLTSLDSMDISPKEDSISLKTGSTLKIYK